MREYEDFVNLSKALDEPRYITVNSYAYRQLQKRPEFLQGDPPRFEGIPVYVDDSEGGPAIVAKGLKDSAVKKMPGKIFKWPKFNPKEKEPWE